VKIGFGRVIAVKMPSLCVIARHEVPWRSRSHTCRHRLRLLRCARNCHQ